MYTHYVDLLDYTLVEYSMDSIHTHIMSCRVTLHQRECVVATREGTTVGMADGCARTSQQWEARQEHNESDNGLDITAELVRSF